MDELKSKRERSLRGIFPMTGWHKGDDEQLARSLWWSFKSAASKAKNIRTTFSPSHDPPSVF